MISLVEMLLVLIVAVVFSPKQGLQLLKWCLACVAKVRSTVHSFVTNIEVQVHNDMVLKDSSIGLYDNPYKEQVHQDKLQPSTKKNEPGNEQELQSNQRLSE